MLCRKCRHFRRPSSYGYGYCEISSDENIKFFCETCIYDTTMPKPKDGSVTMERKVKDEN